jgi:hypothetical protein
MPDKLLTAQEWVERLSEYAETLPLRVRYSLSYITSGTSTASDVETAIYNVEDFYGSPDKAPDWLRCLAGCTDPSDPEILAFCCGEARHWLALELEKFEVTP